MVAEKKNGGEKELLPRVLTGGNNSRVFGCHWLELSMRESAQNVRKIFHDVVAEISGGADTILLKEGTGSRFYRKSMKGRGIWIGWKNVRSDDGDDKLYLQIKGEAFELFGGDIILEFVRRLWVSVDKVIRIDVAYDGLDFGPEDWYKAYKKGETKGKRVDYLENDRGHAARVGILRSDASQVSLYDERGEVRIEFRTRVNSLAKKLADAWIADGDLGLGKAGKSAMRGFVGGNWKVLDDWLEKGDLLLGDARKPKVKELTHDVVISAGKKLVLWGMKNGGAHGVGRLLARAAKEIGASDLHEYGINFLEVAPEFGRIGPDGFNDRAGEVAEVLLEHEGDYDEKSEEAYTS